MLKYSACFASEQLNSITTALAKTTQNLRRLATELSKPQAHFTEQGLRNRIGRWLSDSFVREVLHYSLEQRDNHWQLTFHIDDGALKQLWSQRLGRTVLLTNRLDWSADQVVAGYSGQQQIERVFRGLKDGEWLAWGPMYHWTDSKIRVHACYCMLGLSLLQSVHRQSQSLWPGLTIEQLILKRAVTRSCSCPLEPGMRHFDRPGQRESTHDGEQDQSPALNWFQPLRV